MENYNFVNPKNYTKEHTNYINDYKKTTTLLSKQTNVMLVIRDINSHFITGTDTSAVKFGLKSGDDFEGKSWADIPCTTIADCSEQLKQQEQDLMSTLDINREVETLNVFKFADGLKARNGSNRIFCHKPSKSILGVISTGTDVDLAKLDFINIIPSYILQFGAIGTLEAIDQNKSINNKVFLNAYEQEICFLLLLNWGTQKIANFMNTFRPKDTIKTKNIITKTIEHICQTFMLPDTKIKTLCEYLFAIGFHKTIPSSFYACMLGTTKIIN